MHASFGGCWWYCCMLLVPLSTAAVVLLPLLLLLQAALPSADGGAEPLPEGLLWLLLTGEVRRPLQDTRQPLYSVALLAGMSLT
jgi:hypothetical protein